MQSSDAITPTKTEEEARPLIPDFYGTPSAYVIHKSNATSPKLEEDTHGDGDVPLAAVEPSPLAVPLETLHWDDVTDARRTHIFSVYRKLKDVGEYYFLGAVTAYKNDTYGDNQLTASFPVTKHTANYSFSSVDLSRAINRHGTLDDRVQSIRLHCSVFTCTSENVELVYDPTASAWRRLCRLNSDPDVYEGTQLKQNTAQSFMALANPHHYRILVTSRPKRCDDNSCVVS